MKKFRLAVLTSHPIQYQVPFWRKLAQHPQIDLMVYFCSEYGLKKNFDSGFGINIKWDIPLLEGYQYKFLRNHSPKSNLNGFWALLNLGIVREIWTNRYHVLFINSYAYATHMLSVFIAKLKDTKVAVRSEGNLLMYCPQWRLFMKRLVLPIFFRVPSYFLAIGKLNRDYYEYYGVSDRKIFNTYYAVDNDWFFSQKKILCHKDKLKTKLDIKVTAKVILYVAKFLKRKRPLDLIQAFEKLKYDNAVLVMVGEGEQRSLCEEYVKNKSIKNVYFVGFKNQSELPHFYSIADIFALPSDDETWGLVINEAMCFGRPIITTDQVGSSYDLINHGVNGYIYQAGDIEKLKYYIETLLEDDGLRIKMGKASLKKIQKWGIGENVKELMRAIESF